MAYATITDVSTRLGRTISSVEEIAQVNAWIGDTEVLIRTRIPDLDERITSGALLPAVVTAVVSNVVVRKVKNPDGKQNERIDDYSYGLTEAAARGELSLTDEEWELLLPNAASGAFSVMPSGYYSGPGQWVTPDIWVPLT